MTHKTEDLQLKEVADNIQLLLKILFPFSKVFDRNELLEILYLNYLRTLEAQLQHLHRHPKPGGFTLMDFMNFGKDYVFVPADEVRKETKQ